VPEQRTVYVPVGGVPRSFRSKAVQKHASNRLLAPQRRSEAPLALALLIKGELSPPRGLV
jgi:hypothetical protein